MAKFVCLLSFASAAPFRQWTGFSFDSYMREFEKEYSAFEQNLRMAMFEKRLQQIVDHNDAYIAGNHTWYATVNKYTDWSEEEFMALKTGRIGSGVSTESSKLGGTMTNPIRTMTNPTRFDWREHAVVTEVKDQGSCGSCWAFAATEVMESHYAIATGALVELAPQTYVSCAPNDQHCGGTGGCKGSTPELAFNHTAAHGLALESDYPYTGQDDACTTFSPAVTCDGYMRLPENDASSLETAIATIGPIAVSVATTGWQTYGGGVLSGGCRYPLSPLLECTLNHVVVVVGYDNSGDGYWLVRNSWGDGNQKVKAWGEAGYIRLSRKNDQTAYTNNHPSQGVACEPYPTSQQVMGEGGVLYDMVYPIGVRAMAILA